MKYYAILIGIALCLSACAEMRSSVPRKELNLACDLITKNARGDIDPVPSLDGRYVAYRRMTDESPVIGELHLSRLEQPAKSTALLKAGEFYGGASWSPDSNWISYTVFEKKSAESMLVKKSIYKINIHTREKIRLVDGWTISGSVGEYTSWTARNEVVFATADAFYTIDAEGGSPKKTSVRNQSLPEEPQHLAADSVGTLIAFSIDTRDYDDQYLRSSFGIWIANLDSGQLVRLTRDSPDTFPVWRNDDTILFLRELPERKTISLFALSPSTGTVEPVEHEGILFSLAQAPHQKFVYTATAPTFDLSGDDLNLFRGFSIAKCRLLERR
ncbi:MAG: hypothetical protein GXP15_08285 [Gammaproteobacteria bacterium]|nr:hypothetical protein [Gammaproteobacteria bacterium]